MKGSGRSLARRMTAPGPPWMRSTSWALAVKIRPGSTTTGNSGGDFQGWLTSVLQTWVVMVGTKLRSSARRTSGMSAGSRWTCMSAEYQPVAVHVDQAAQPDRHDRVAGDVQVELDRDVLQPALDPEPVPPGLEVELELTRDQEVPLVAPRVGREPRGQEGLVSSPQVDAGGDRLTPGVVHDLDAHRGAGRGAEPGSRPAGQGPRESRSDPQALHRVRSTIRRRWSPKGSGSSRAISGPSGGNAMASAARARRPRRAAWPERRGRGSGSASRRWGSPGRRPAGSGRAPSSPSSRTGRAASSRP